MPVGRGRDLIAHHDRRRVLRCRAIEVGADFLEPVGVGKRRIVRKVESPVGEVGVERIHLSIERSGGRLKRPRLAQRYVARGPVRRHLAGIDLVSQVAIHHPSRPRGRAQRHARRAAARDAGDEPVRMAEVEARIESERHDGGRGVRGSLAGEDSHLAVAVHAHRVITRRQRIDAVEMVALHPVLQLAGLVAGVVAHFEHGHNHYLHRDRPGPGPSERSGREAAERCMQECGVSFIAMVKQRTWGNVGTKAHEPCQARDIRYGESMR